MRRFLHRTHIWLGWIIGGQLFLWMLSGLVMTALPIGEVRGEHLRREAPARLLAGLSGLAPPEALLQQAGPKGDGLLLKWLGDTPVYLLLDGKEPRALLDARTGAPIRIDATRAAGIALNAHVGDPRIDSVVQIDPANPPLEFRRDAPAFAVRFDDGEGSTFYVHAISGEILAVRTDRWRLFDLMWGLHIMDWRGREDMNHPLLFGAAALGLAGVTGGIALLLLRQSRRGMRRTPARARGAA